MRNRPSSVASVLSAVAILLAGLAVGAEKKEWPVSTPEAGAQIAENQWSVIERHGAGRRGQAALIYLAKEKAFLHVLGSIGAWNDHGPWPYDELTLKLKDRVWENRFPAGKEAWGPPVGVCSNVPPVPSHGFRIKDKEGNPRVGLWEGGFGAFSQVVLDTDRNRIVAYTHNRIIEYDADARTWQEVKTTNNPCEGLQKLWWGALCYDPVNKEIVMFGGNNGPSEFNDPRTWVYSPATATWRRVEPGSEWVKGGCAKARALRIEGEGLHGAYCNRYFKTGLASDEAVKLSGAAKKLTAGIEALKGEVAGKGEGYEKVQCERAATDLVAAAALAAKLGDEANPESLATALELHRTLWRVECDLMSEPPPRANSPMVFDPATKKIVLFGGDRLDMIYSDVWVYDCATRTWEERRPEVVPSPRAGHAFLTLPKSGKLLLLGGYQTESKTGYWEPLYQALPVQAWTYDVAANKWQLVKDWGSGDGKKPDSPPVFMSSKGALLTAAADDEDTVIALSGEDRSVVTRACKINASAVDAEGQAKAAVKPGAADWRTGPYDPNWFAEGPAPDETAFQAVLAGLPVNMWTNLTAAKGFQLPKQNRDWGTAVFDPERRAIYRWSGGHSAHCGTDIPVFSMRTGRYHIKYPPAFPLEGIGSCGSQPSLMAFMGQPWISAHTYHSYAYDPVSKKMICCGHQSQSFAYEPGTGRWTRKPQPKGMREDCFYTLTLCATPTGPYAWTKFGTLFKYDGAKEEWSEVKTSGEKLVGTACDASGMCYDSKRDRLILTHNGFKGDLVAIDLKTATAGRLAPKGMDVAAKGGLFTRESVYVPDLDLVVVTTLAKNKTGAPDPWPVYDCEKNAWVMIDIGGPNASSCGAGLMYDPVSKLLLMVNPASQVFALRLDPKTAKAAE